MKMRSATLTALLLLTTAFCVLGQNSSKSDPSTTSTATTTTAATTARPSPPDYVRPDGHTRLKRYVNSMFGPMALAEDVALGGINTARNSPEEWGPHWEGFGKRVASGVGRGIIKDSVQYGLDEAFKLDSYYYRSTDKSVGARIKNALISPVTARRTDGSRTIGFPHIIGVYAGSVISRKAWYPPRYTLSDDLVSGSISMGFNVGMNLFKEFVWKK
jgi:hypothetical protein